MSLACHVVDPVPLAWSLDEGGDPDGLVRLVAEQRTAGAPAVRWWVEDTADRHLRAAERAGLVAVRRLLQMRRPLPLEVRTDLPTRPFRPGEDDQRWLEVNNRAFAWHPEQGGWTRDDLAERMAEPWFDPAGFLLHDDGDRLVGFCWTKVHADTSPALGEIYVIAVDPDHAGRGLGRALTIAGLQHLAGRGLTVAMLYVESDNTAAVALYEDLGFSVHHVDTAFELAFD
jgi:mycothiol synthase